MASELIKPELSSKIKEILLSNGISEPISSIKLNDSGLRGQNFASVTDTITVTFQDDPKPLNLFVKNSVKGSAHAEMIADIQLFKKEMVFFNKYIPEARQICEQRGLEHLMEIYPKCYYADESMIIFENLVIDKGYVLLKWDNPQELEPAKLGVKNVALHHAISKAVIEKYGGVEEFLEAYPIFKFDPWADTDSMKNSMGPMLEAALPTTIAILEKSGVSGAEEGVKLLKSMQGHIWDKIVEASKINEDDFKLLIHGDYHNNNMLFKQDQDGKVTDQIPIDYQIVRINTSGFDLSYYMFTSVNQEARGIHLEELFQLYLDTLNETAEKLGCPIGMEMSELRKYYKNSFKMGFWLAYGWSNGGAKVDMDEINMEEIDVRNMSGFEEVGAKMAKYFDKMLETHPEWLEENAKTILSLLEEHNNIEKWVC